MLREHPPCPKCGSRKVAQIVYGLINVTDEFKKFLDRGDVLLGGCCVDSDSPSWHCHQCQHDWGNWADDEQEPPSWDRKENLI